MTSLRPCFGLCLDLFAAHFQLNSLLLLPTEGSENHLQNCVCSYFHLHCNAFVCSRIDYCNSLLIALPKNRLSPLQTVLNAVARLIARLSRYSHISSYIKEHLHCLPISTRIEYKVLLIVLKAQMGVVPKYLRDANRLLPHSFVLYASLTCGSSLSLGLGQLWLNLDPFPLLTLPFGIAFHHQLALLSYHPIFLFPYHFFKLVYFLGANRTANSTSVGPRLLRGE